GRSLAFGLLGATLDDLELTRRGARWWLGAGGRGGGRTPGPSARRSPTRPRSTRAFRVGAQGRSAGRARFSGQRRLVPPIGGLFGLFVEITGGAAEGMGLERLDAGARIGARGGQRKQAGRDETGSA